MTIKQIAQSFRNQNVRDYLRTVRRNSRSPKPERGALNGRLDPQNLLNRRIPSQLLVDSSLREYHTKYVPERRKRNENRQSPFRTRPINIQIITSTSRPEPVISSLVPPEK